MYPIELAQFWLSGGLFVAAAAVQDARQGRRIDAPLVWGYLFFSLLSLPAFWAKTPISGSWIGAVSVYAIFVLMLHATRHMGEADALVAVGLVGYAPYNAINAFILALFAFWVGMAWVGWKKGKKGKRTAFMPFLALAHLVAFLLSVAL